MSDSAELRWNERFCETGLATETKENGKRRHGAGSEVATTDFLTEPGIRHRSGKHPNHGHGLTPRWPAASGPIRR